MKVIAEVVLRREIDTDEDSLAMVLTLVDAALAEVAAANTGTRWDMRMIQRTVVHAESGECARGAE